jgi:hypothetical protein
MVSIGLFQYKMCSSHPTLLHLSFIIQKPQRKFLLELSAGVFYTHGVAAKALCRSDLTRKAGTQGTLPNVCIMYTDELLQVL